MLTLDAPDVVNKSSKASVTAIDAIRSTCDLTCRDYRKLLMDDDLLRDSEVYYETREHSNNMAAGRDCVNKHGGRTSICNDCVNDHIGREGTLSCDAAQIRRASKVSFHSGRSMIGRAEAFPLHTPSLHFLAKLDVVSPFDTMRSPSRTWTTRLHLSKSQKKYVPA